MKWLAIFLAFVTTAWSEDPGQRWITEDFSKAEEMARSYDLPLMLVFTGSDWSPESEKLIVEFLAHSERAKALKEVAIVVHLDFPELNIQSGQQVEQNFALKQRFHVHHFPTVVLLDPHLNEITRLGYPIDSISDYAIHIKEVLRSYHLLASEFDRAQEKRDEQLLMSSFQSAQKLGFPKLCDRMIAFATEEHLSPSLLLEQYAKLVSKGEGTSEEAQLLRKEILKHQMANREKIRSRLVLLDFQNDRDTTQLEHFLEQFDATQTDLYWKMQLVLSEELFNENQTKEALEHAQLSYRHAPAERKQDVADLIDLISKKTH